MAPKALKKAKLADIKPTQAEWEAAKKILAELETKPQMKKNQMSQFAYWLKNNGLDNKEVMFTRGEQRQKYFAQFLVRKICDANAAKELVNEHTKSNSTN